MHQMIVAGFLLGEHLGDALEAGRPECRSPARPRRESILATSLAHVIQPVDAPTDEILVLPTVLEDVPEHAPEAPGCRCRAGS